MLMRHGRISHEAHARSLLKTFPETPGNGRTPNLLSMPAEILLSIASNPSPSSRDVLSLTCKRFMNTLSPLVGLQVPAEQPPNFQKPSMSGPQDYQFERWDFLRLLEKDLFDRWLTCYDCFTLHPAHVFEKPEGSLVSWFKQYTTSPGPQSRLRSCFDQQRVPTTKGAHFVSSSGLIDLCPCFKLTPEVLGAIPAKFRELERENNHKRWWHICRHIYGDVDLEIDI